MFWRFIGWIFDTAMIGSNDQKNRDFIINHNIKWKK